MIILAIFFKEKLSKIQKICDFGCKNLAQVISLVHPNLLLMSLLLHRKRENRSFCQGLFFGKKTHGWTLEESGPENSHDDNHFEF